MRAETRHQLKQDRFSKVAYETAEKTVHWTTEHKSTLTIAGIILIVVVAAALGSWYYYQQQDRKASVEFTQAVRTLQTPLRPAGAPEQPGFPSFTSAKERAEAAHKQFEDIAKNYPHTHASQFAQYFLGLTEQDMGNNAAAEKDLKAVADASNQDLAALAKFALASLYRGTNRSKEAIDLYKQLADKPTRTVGKATAQLEMAASYEAMQQPHEAKIVYEQVQKENPNSDAAQIASARMQQLK